MKAFLCLVGILTIASAVGTLGSICVGSVSVSQSARTNNLCSNGYYWNNQACMPCQYVYGGYYTCTSYLGTGTLTCNSGYSQIEGQCVSIPYGCATIQLNSNKNAFECGSCSSSYTLISGVCIYNNYCTTWDDNAVCTACGAGYYLNWDLQYALPSLQANSTWTNYPSESEQSFCSSCSQTMPNCKSCNSAYTCSTCNDGYFWQQSTSATKLTSQNSQNAGSCVSCLSGCQTCTSAGVCSACQTNYYPTKDANNNITQCTICQPGGCSACTSLNQCTSCYSGSFMFTNNSCYSMNNCQGVTVSSTTSGASPYCSSCVTNYALNATGTCIKCPSNCYSCSVPTNSQNTTSCTTCQDTYYGVKDANGIVTCSSCSLITGFLRCSGPVENSSYTTQVPSQCQDGYYLYTIPAQGSTNAQTVCIKSVQSQQCVLIQATVQTQYTCTACTTPITALYNNSQCYACDSTLTSSLPTGCSTCSGTPANSISCTACASNYFFATANSAASCTYCNDYCVTCGSGPACTQCIAGYYVSAGSCTKCGVDNCSVCSPSTPTQCTTCLGGYFLISVTSNSVTTQYCLSCPSECLTCAPNGQSCLTCANGYVMQNGGCVNLQYANCAQGIFFNTFQQYSQTGCAICQYGFYNFQNRCLQIVQPYAAAIYKPLTTSIGTSPSTVFEAVLSISLLILLAY